MTRRYLPAGAGALLVELPDLAHTLDLLAALQAAPLAGVRELVPAARTLLIHFDRVGFPHASILSHVICCMQLFLLFF